MRRSVKIGVAVVLIFLFAPIVPLPYPKIMIFPWSSQCYGGGGIEARVLVFASPAFILFQKGVAVVPQSNRPVQFNTSTLPNGELCG